MIVSIIGKSGSGKTTLVEDLLQKSPLMSRVKGDAYAKSIEDEQSVNEYFSRCQIDWDLMNIHLSQPIGSMFKPPHFDYKTFKRSTGISDKEVEVRPIMLIDQIYPHPDADLVICCEISELTRKFRSIKRNLQRRRGIQLFNKFRAKNDLSPMNTPNLRVDMFVNSYKPRAKNAQLVLDFIMQEYGSVSSST